MPQMTARDVARLMGIVANPSGSPDHAPGVSFEAEMRADGETLALFAEDRHTLARTRLLVPAADVRRLRPSESGARALVPLLRGWQWALLWQLRDRVCLELGIRGEV